MSRPRQSVPRVFLRLSVTMTIGFTLPASWREMMRVEGHDRLPAGHRTASL